MVSLTLLSAATFITYLAYKFLYPNTINLSKLSKSRLSKRINKLIKSEKSIELNTFSMSSEETINFEKTLNSLEPIDFLHPINPEEPINPDETKVYYQNETYTLLSITNKNYRERIINLFYIIPKYLIICMDSNNQVGSIEYYDTLKNDPRYTVYFKDYTDNIKKIYICDNTDIINIYLQKVDSIYLLGKSVSYKIQSPIIVPSYIYMQKYLSDKIDDYTVFSYGNIVALNYKDLYRLFVELSTWTRQVIDK